MHTSPELARALLRHGTMTIVADPHEITNVLGMQGIRFMLGASNCLPVDFFMLPSCVPAIHMETAGAQFAAEDLLILKGKSRVLILAEVMNYQGVLACLEPVLNEIKAFNGSVQDGHASLLASRNLNTYITEDIGSDPECAQIEEAREENKARHACHDPQKDASEKPPHPASPGFSGHCQPLFTCDG